MSRKQLTSKQHSFLEFIAEYVRKNKIWPTYREIVDHFGYRSPNSVTQNLHALAKKGYLLRDDHGYRLLGQHTGVAGVGFPVQGSLSDGRFEVSIQIEEVTLRDLFPRLSEAHAVRVEESVRGVDVDDGGYLLLEDGSIEDGTMIVAVVDGKAAVCRAFLERDVYRLQHTDGEQVHRSVSEVDVLGRYAGHINRRGLFRLPDRQPSAVGAAA